MEGESPRIIVPQICELKNSPPTFYKRKVPSLYAVAAEMSTPRGSCNQATSPAPDAQCSRCRGHTVGRIDRRAKDELPDNWYHFIAENLDHFQYWHSYRNIVK